MSTKAPNISPRPSSRTDEVACEARCVDPDATKAARAAVGSLQLRDTAPLLGALGDPTRLRLLSALLVSPLCTCDLAFLLGVSDSAVSHQLRLLKDLQLVVSRRDGRIVYHELAGAHVHQFVERVCEEAREVHAAR